LEELLFVIRSSGLELVPCPIQIAGPLQGFRAHFIVSEWNLGKSEPVVGFYIVLLQQAPSQIGSTNESGSIRHQMIQFQTLEQIISVPRQESRTIRGVFIGNLANGTHVDQTIQLFRILLVPKGMMMMRISIIIRCFLFG
jgi:hypothetical protein